MIFIVGTGRSGTKAIIDASYGFHEYGFKNFPNSDISRIFKSHDKFYSDPFVNNDKTKDMIREYLSGAESYKEFMCADNNFCFFLKDLYELYPQSLILHIVRDGRDCATSMLNRNWHNYNQFGHLPLVNTKNYELFINKFNDLQKCAWIWNDRIEKILKYSEKFDERRYKTVKIEDLSNSKNIQSIEDFLSTKIEISILNSKINSNLYSLRSLKKQDYHTSWSTNENNDFMKIAKGSLMRFKYV